MQQHFPFFPNFHSSALEFSPVKETLRKAFVNSGSLLSDGDVYGNLHQVKPKVPSQFKKSYVAIYIAIFYAEITTREGYGLRSILTMNHTPHRIGKNATLFPPAVLLLIGAL